MSNNATSKSCEDDTAIPQFSDNLLAYNAKMFSLL